MQSIEIESRTFAEFKSRYRAAQELPVTLEGYIYKGVWECKDGELLFASVRIPIVKIGRSTIRVLVDREEVEIVKQAGEGKGRYLLVLSV